MTVDYIEAVHDVMIQHVLNFQMIVWQQTTIYINKIVHAIACDGSARGVFGIWVGVKFNTRYQYQSWINYIKSVQL